MMIKIFLVSFVVAVLSCSGLWVSTIQLPQTGLTQCYWSGGEIPCAGSGQDGEFRADAPWPGLRFIDHGDGTVTDMLTGLMWAVISADSYKSTG